MFAILKKARQIDMPADIMISLFHKLVTPIMTYNCEIWVHETKENDKLNELHLKFLRFMFNLNQSTPKPMIYRIHLPGGR